MRERTSSRALVIGGGIGGLSVAIALQQAGFDVTVFERAEELREVGSGLPLWTNALRALHKIGLNHILETLGAPITAGSVSTWQGDILADLRIEKLLKRLGTINAVVHRAELLALLVEALGADSIQLGMTCVGFIQDAIRSVCSICRWAGSTR